MAWSYVGGNLQIGGGGQGVTTFNSLGSKILICASTYQGTSAQPPYDTMGNIWTYCYQAYSNSLNWMGLWVALNPATNASHTFYTPGNCFTGSIQAMGWTGSHPTLSKDQVNNGSDSAYTGPITPTTDGQLCIAALSVGGGGAPPNNITDGYIFLQNGANNGQSFGLTVAYRIMGAKVATQPVWQGMTGGLAPVLVSFFPPSAAKQGSMFNVF